MSRRSIVDAHHHLWDLDHGHAYPWLQDAAAGEGMLGDLAPISRTYLPADYRADTAGYELAGSVHIEAVPNDPLRETRWLNSLGGNIPTAIVARAELNAPDAEAVIAAQAAAPKVRGIRQIVNYHRNAAVTFTPADLLQDSAWQAGYALLRKYGLSFDMQLYPGQMAGALELARRHPDTLMIVNHTGMPVDRGPSGEAPWRDGMAALAAADNVVVKISGLGMVEHRWTPASIRPFVLGSIERFGVDRCMFGSNFPVDRLYSSFGVLYGAFEAIVSDFSPAEQDQLFRTNAQRWYRL